MAAQIACSAFFGLIPKALFFSTLLFDLNWIVGKLMNSLFRFLKCKVVVDFCITI